MITKLVLLLGSAAVAAATAAADPSFIEREFEEWLEQNPDLRFSTRGEYSYRLSVFAENSRTIAEHNALPDTTYTLGHNEFSHLTWEEFKAPRLGGFKKHSKVEKYDEEEGEEWDEVAEVVMVARRRLSGITTANGGGSVGLDLPESVDWSTANPAVVTSVKNQGLCGSCWAFSAVGALEGAFALSGDAELVDLSEQQLLDCDAVDGGCQGGEMESAFDWIKENDGICSLEDYPYKSRWLPFRRQCQECSPVPGTQVDHWEKVGESDEELMAALTRSPVAIAIEADKTAFMLYKDGVMSATCGNNLDHGVLAVGYGTTEDGVDYWKVKNSWGPTWGQEGYILLARGAGEEEGGECGLLMDATYPVLASTSISTTPSDERWAPLGNSAHGSDCGGQTTASFPAIDISPTSPKRGKAVTMTADGTLSKALSSGRYTMDVDLGGSNVYSHEGSVCGDSKAKLPLGLGKIKIHGPPCPLEAGSISMSIEVSLPRISPPGKYSISFSGTDQDLTDLLCLNFELKI